MDISFIKSLQNWYGIIFLIIVLILLKRKSSNSAPVVYASRKSKIEIDPSLIAFSLSHKKHFRPNRFFYLILSAFIALIVSIPLVGFYVIIFTNPEDEKNVLSKSMIINLTIIFALPVWFLFYKYISRNRSLLEDRKDFFRNKEILHNDHFILISPFLLDGLGHPEVSLAFRNKQNSIDNINYIHLYWSKIKEVIVDKGINGRCYYCFSIDKNKQVILSRLAFFGKEQQFLEIIKGYGVKVILKDSLR